MGKRCLLGSGLNTLLIIVQLICPIICAITDYQLDYIGVFACKELFMNIGHGGAIRFPLSS